jgi:hypothetical protein
VVSEQGMKNKCYHVAKRVYPSEKGIHMEFGSPELAKEFFNDGSSRGIGYELDNCTVIKPFKVKKQNPTPDESEMGLSG